MGEYLSPFITLLSGMVVDIAVESVVYAGTVVEQQPGFMEGATQINPPDAAVLRR